MCEKNEKNHGMTFLVGAVAAVIAATINIANDRLFSGPSITNQFKEQSIIINRIDKGMGVFTEKAKYMEKELSQQDTRITNNTNSILRFQ